MRRGTLLEVWDGSGDPYKGAGRVGRSSVRSETDWETLPEVQDGSGDSLEVWGRVARL